MILRVIGCKFVCGLATTGGICLYGSRLSLNWEPSAPICRFSQPIRDDGGLTCLQISIATRLKTPLSSAEASSERGRNWVVGQFDCGTRILRVIHGRDARATSQTDALLEIDNHFQLEAYCEGWPLLFRFR